MIPQDLHIHTVYSVGDSAVVKEQTIDLVKQIRHASIIGISDHYEYLVDEDIFRMLHRGKQPLHLEEQLAGKAMQVR